MQMHIYILKKKLSSSSHNCSNTAWMSLA